VKSEIHNSHFLAETLQKHKNAKKCVMLGGELSKTVHFNQNDIQ